MKAFLRRTPVTKTKRYQLADALRVKAELDAMPQHEPEEISGSPSGLVEARDGVRWQQGEA
jgi:hypothetical protein